MATGVVVAFDQRRGWGTVRAGGGAEVFFHCTAVADGSRTIQIGTTVDYEVVPGHLGRWEARAIRPAQAPPAGRGATATRSSGPPVTSTPPAR